MSGGVGASSVDDQALAVPVEPASSLAPSGFDPSRKGGFEQEEWQDRYARQFEALGWTRYEAECEALNAWESSPDDTDPSEAACADIAYMAEDGE